MSEQTRILTPFAKPMEEKLVYYLNKEGFISDCDIPSPDIFDVYSLQRYQDIMSSVYSVPVCMIDADGEEMTRRSGYANEELLEECRLHIYELSSMAGISRRVEFSKRGFAAVPFIIGACHMASWIIDLTNSSAVICREFEKMAQIISERYMSLFRRMSQEDHNRQAKGKLAKVLRRNDLIVHCHKILNSSGKEKINTLLSYLGQELRYSRVYISERTPAGLFEVIYEWNAPNITPIPKEYRAVHFNTKSGFFYKRQEPVIFDSREIQKSTLKTYFAGTGTRSSVHLPVFDNDKITAIVALDECNMPRIYFKEDRDTLNSLLQTIAGAVNDSVSSRRIHYISSTEKLISDIIIPEIIKYHGDISATYNKNKTLIESRPYTDELLGIGNIRKLSLDIKALFERNPRAYGVLIGFDIDNFSAVNNYYGTQTGDKLIRLIYEFILSFKPDAIYRFGGDEFAVLFEGFEDESCSDLVENIWSRFNKPWIVEDLEIVTAVSIGATRFPKDGTDNIMRNCAQALSMAKQEKKTVYFRDGLKNAFSNRANLTEKLFQAVKNKEFRVYYQPVIDIQSNRVAGAEALLRLPLPNGGFISPSEFLPIAEAVGLMKDIGRWVLRTAVHDLKHWISDNFHLAVNLSMSQVQSRDLVDEIMGILNDEKINPEHLVFEVSEFMAAYDVEFGYSQLNLLRLEGVRVALDNYGLETSDLSRLPHMPFDIANIDMQYVKNMQHNTFCDTVVQTFIEIAKSVGFYVCAEGVEYQEQYLDLKDYGCDFALGYYFSPAKPISEFENYISQAID